jgi:hypothetical protein
MLLQVPYEQSYTQLGRLLYDGTNPRTDVEDKPGLKRLTERQYVPCFPLESLLLAIGQTRIDYFSLDVEGLELDVLETIPWKQFDIRTISVEYKHVKRGKQAVIDYMTRQGYRLVADLRANQPGQSIFVEDFVFVRR